MTVKTAKCHFCSECNGYGCPGELPGMGGIRNNINFQLNCADWNIYPRNVSDDDLYKCKKPLVRLAPITGSVENIGFETEEPYYQQIINACVEAGIELSIGDGCPDEKIKYGIAALKNAGKKGAVFIKPYANEKILERIEWAKDVAEIAGIDIDSYNIVTMRNLVKLEQKNAAQIKELRQKSQKPFAIKGVFTGADIELVKEVKPEIVVISNHGGRVENRTGSTIDFFAEHAKELKNYAGEIWIDGGIRKERDLYVASYFGASQIMIARPLISALCKGGKEEVKRFVKDVLKA